MPELSLPEVRLKDKLPEGLRSMNLDDIQKAIPDVRLPSFELPKVEIGREAQRAARRADKASRRAQKAAAREASKAARAVENALPRRPGPNPVPVAILAMLGGLVIGWLLANNPVTGPKISAWLDDLRMRFDAWRGGGFDEDDEWDTTDPVAYPESLRAPVEPTRFADELSPMETGVGVGPGQLPEGLGTDDPARVGADER